MPLLGILKVANMYFNAFHENKILTKISDLTVKIEMLQVNRIKLGGV